MRRYLLALFIILGVSAFPHTSIAGPTPVGAVMGGNVLCDPTNPGCQAFPISGSILCNGTAGNLNCPQFFHPDWSQSPGTTFYGITNRVNPPLFIVSTDGGTVWSPVAVQPFTAAVLNFGASMAVSSDGSLLAASGQGANLCIIRRSTDNGASWTTVFTSLVQNCSLGFVAPTPPGMYCHETNGYCAFVNPFVASTITVIYSTDNGATWTVGVTYSHISSDARTWGPILEPGGVNGILIRGVNPTAPRPFGVKSGNDFTGTVNFAPPVNLNCRPLFMRSSAHAVCAPNAGGDLYQFTTGGALGIAPLVINTFTPEDTSGILEPQVVGFDAITGYMIQVSFATPTRLNLFVTRNTWGSVVRVSQIIPTTAPSSACCKGNIMRWGNRIYFSSGSTSSQAFLGVIQ